MENKHIEKQNTNNRWQNLLLASTALSIAICTLWLGPLPLALCGSALRTLSFAICGSALCFLLFTAPPFALYFLRLRTLTIALCLLPFASFAQTLSLQNAVELALKNYPTIQQATLQIQQQKALVGTATILDPFNVNSGVGQINSHVVDYNVGVSQGFRLPNAYKAGKNLLNQNVVVAESYVSVTKNELTRNVSAAYFDWAYSWQQYNLLLQTDSIFADYEKYANKKYQVGESNKLEKINATLQRKDLQIQLSKAKTGVAFYLLELQKWMQTGQPYQAPQQFVSLPQINLGDSSLAGRHPILQFLRQQVVAKDLAVKAEKAKGLPSFSLGINAQSLDKQQPFYYGSVGINIPVFKNGVKARTQAAKFEAEIAKKELDKNQQEIATLFLQQDQWQQQNLQQLQYYETEGLPMAESIINAAQRSYKAGDIGYIEYIQNIKDAIKIKTDHLAATNNYNQTIVQLGYLLNR